MFLENKEIRKMLYKTQCQELTDCIKDRAAEDYPDMSELEQVADEAEYLFNLYGTKGTVHYADLHDAWRILWHTKKGKRVVIDRETKQPIYSDVDIEVAKEIDEEYARLKIFVKRIRRMM